ncbi:MAG: DUF4832 domain-containing protein [Firmicutes bacterium]|nr:DUF4832 domain-containing protein [Bacillota bacterium]
MATLYRMMPRPLNNPIKNPGRGWALYVDAFFTDVRDVRFDDSGFPDAARYWALQDASGATEYASLLYLRVPWSQMEPSLGIYAWEADENFQALLEGARARGLRTAFRVYVDSHDSYQQATPDFVRQLGAEGYIDSWQDSRGHVHQYWNPWLSDSVFQQQLTRFLEAFASRFDDSQCVDFIDAGGLGWWGEMHHLGIPPGHAESDVLQWVATVYQQCFSRVLLGWQYVATPIADALVGSRQFVIRRDSLGSPIWFPETERRPIIQHWPAVPVFAENCYHHLQSRSEWWSGDGFSSLRETLETVVSHASEIHANTLDLRIPEDAEAWMQVAPDIVRDLSVRLGYCFRLLEVRYHSRLPSRANLSISHRWTNVGFGRIPNDDPHWQHKYRVAWSLIGQRGIASMFVDTTIDISQWLPGIEYEYRLQWPLSLSEGRYQLGVAIVDSSKGNTPAVGIASEGFRNIDGWMVVGEVLMGA